MKRSRPLNVLLVEGDTDSARKVAGMLSGDGHAVSRAGTLAEANDLCEDGRFDLLITGSELPDGPACELIAEQGSCAGIPGIIVAGKDDDLCSVSLGFGARLGKPVMLPELRSAIARVTSSR